MHILENIGRALSSVGSFIYPSNIKCPYCGEEAGFCNCIGQIRRVKNPLCPYCGRTLSRPHDVIIDDNITKKICGTCYSKPLKIGAHRSYGIYEGPLRDGIIKLKYHDKIFLSKEFGEKLAQLYFHLILEGEEEQEFFGGGGFPVIREAPEDFTGIDYVTYIPSSATRYLKRGFNQSLEIARHFCKITGLELTHLLKRIKNTKRLILLGSLDRQLELINAIIVPESLTKTIRGKKILLIDDIFTTGATMNASARALLDAGARAVVAMSVAMEE